MARPRTTGAVLAGYIDMPVGASQLSCNDSSGNGNYTISDYHYDRSKHLPEWRHRENITITNGRQRYNRPINTFRDTGEAILFTLDEIHHRAQNNDHSEHREQEDGDLPTTVFERSRERVCLFHVVDQLQHPKNPKNPKEPND